MKILAVGIALWTLPLLALISWRGWGSLHAQEYRFFTQAALVTFGGAYAVLAYVTQAAAGSFGWMTKTQAVEPGNARIWEDSIFLPFYNTTLTILTIHRSLSRDP